MTTVLIVEDDLVLNEGLAYALGNESYDIVSAHSYQEGLSAFRSREVHLILLDVTLPDRKGTDLCKEIRRESDVPIIFLTANDTEQDMVLGFKLGADDYMAKPFSIAVLRERVKAVLRRGGGDDNGSTLTYKDLNIHFDKMKVFKRSEEIRLTTNEYKLLSVLAQNRNQVLTREQIVERLWDVDGCFVDENTLSVNIKRLRSKIEDNPKQPTYIKTVFGIGYTWGE
ncbi:DNA-binding response regulator [Paenibacillus sp. CCS19]|uniref:response regulator transcription factor n=1 Tax=Paenibacillus sp. CCS19 TaxID=3158387 RepID=UPI002566ADE9|nr:response regulator transcription factor [Paenibacillus cellulosilyticus]GMK39758.1 DNA-binding response regulator [Paenibacillus cellulosilyticus]